MFSVVLCARPIRQWRKPTGLGGIIINNVDAAGFALVRIQRQLKELPPVTDAQSAVKIGVAHQIRTPGNEWGGKLRHYRCFASFDNRSGRLYAPAKL